jgi:FkbM family methyltransferase
MKRFVYLLTPPWIYQQLLKISRILNKSGLKPKWNTIENGLLKGHKLFVNNKTANFKEMVAGSYDNFFWNHIDVSEFGEGDQILDIGGHIGFHSMNFAKLVEGKGKVHVFEPNRFNVDRIKINLSENPTLKAVVNIHDVALSNENRDDVEFTFSDCIDDETSSGGFIDGSFKPLADEVYADNSFQKEKVRVRRLDDLVQEAGIGSVKMMKIDVEGAEQYVIEGALNTLKTNKPKLLIEIHSVIAMLNVTQLLYPLGYKIEVIQEEDAGRCFIKCV